MTSPRAVYRNWRDSDSYLGHDNAIVWPIFMSPAEDDPRPHRCLTLLSGFAGHSLQGGKSTDYHAHANAEQYYYILSGGGEVLIGDTRHPVGEGSVTYFPPGVPHQFFAENEEEGVEHLIITCPVEREGSEPRILNWRDATPTAGVHGAAVTWLLLESMAEGEPATDQPCLLSFYYLARQALVRGKASDSHAHDDKEQVYYILEGRGLVIADGDVHSIGEGDTIYLPRGVQHQIINHDYNGWLTYLVVS